MIASGVLLIVAVLIVLVGEFLADEYNGALLLAQLIINVVAIVLLFLCKAPIWMPIIAIIGAVASLIALTIRVLADEVTVFAIIMLFVGIICCIVLGVLCFV